MKRALVILALVAFSAQHYPITPIHRYIFASEYNGHVVFDIVYGDGGYYPNHYAAVQFKEFRDGAQALATFGHLRQMHVKELGLTTTSEGTFVVYWE